MTSNLARHMAYVTRTGLVAVKTPTVPQRLTVESGIAGKPTSIRHQGLMLVPAYAPKPIIPWYVAVPVYRAMRPSALNASQFGTQRNSRFQS